MTEILEWINGFVWGVPSLILILGVGLYLSARSRFAQIRLFPAAIKHFAYCFQKGEDAKKVTSFQALCTALAATVGTGNIAGVAGAIALGGPGSIFWMWVCAFLGMVTKFAEAVLSVQYRKQEKSGESRGGPMYMIEAGMGNRWRPMAVCYSLFGVVAAFGMGNATQINAVVDCVTAVRVFLGRGESLPVNLIVGAALAVVTAVVLLGGAERIGNVASLLVPAASAAYLVMGAGAIFAHGDRIIPAFRLILEGAFSPGAVTGGMIGSLFTALRIGASRGVFTNEAGMGTAAMAHGTSRVDHPIEQGLMGIMEVFIDTILICTITALVILTSGTHIPYGTDEGAALTARAFACTYGQWVSIPIALFLCCFAFGTMLGWGLYGLRCAEYLFGSGVWKVFVLMQAVISVISVLLKTGTVWMLAETVNGLMAIPNLICLAALSPVLFRLTVKWQQKSAPLGALRR